MSDSEVSGSELVSLDEAYAVEEIRSHVHPSLIPESGERCRLLPGEVARLRRGAEHLGACGQPQDGAQHDR